MVEVGCPPRYLGGSEPSDFEGKLLSEQLAHYFTMHVC